MTKLEVSGEFDPLRGADVTVCNEDHVCDRASRKHISTSYLTDQVETAVLIGYCHDYGNRYKHYCSNA